ncbi:hypothetical protein F4861DRAFT_528240 [Xylaria intraflava]|nr:hypothetical protein F4861DRAFT_528240 [Xylaria intraflava]
MNVHTSTRLIFTIFSLYLFSLYSISPSLCIFHGKSKVSKNCGSCSTCRTQHLISRPAVLLGHFPCLVFQGRPNSGRAIGRYIFSSCC